MLLTTALLLSAAPFDVRVLERLTPTRAQLTAKAISCDGKPLPVKVDLEVGEREVKVGSALCNVVRAEGEVAVTVGEETRRYPGAVSVNLEAARLRFIDHVELEAYLPAVVAAEEGGAPAAALEAQAVASRTFALASRKRHHEDGYDLCDMTHCQLYRGRTDETKASRAAVMKTQGQVLLVGGLVLKPAFFHAACGGHTSAAGDVFRDEGVGVGVRDDLEGGPACRATPDFSWEWKVDRVALAKALGVKPEGSAFEPLRRDAAGRVLEVRTFGKRLSGPSFQSLVGRAFGWQVLRSMKLTAEQVDNTVRFSGTGFGHGVGLCQQGARARAERGESSQSILKRYFPDARVSDSKALEAH